MCQFDIRTLGLGGWGLPPGSGRPLLVIGSNVPLQPSALTHLDPPDDILYMENALPGAY